MMVQNVAGRKMIAATRAINQAGGIELLRPVQNPDGIELTPTFVERDPDDDAGMIAATVDHRLEFASVDFGGRCRAAHLLAIYAARTARCHARGRAGHVVP